MGTYPDLRILWLWDWKFGAVMGALEPNLDIGLDVRALNPGHRHIT